MDEYKELRFDEDDDDDEGICLVCGCTSGDACSDEEGNACSWTDEEKNLCSFCEETGSDLSGLKGGEN